jgi:hypothetical protein
MRKTVSLMLLALLLCVSGCGSSGNDNKTAAEAETAAAAAETAAKAAVQAASAAADTAALSRTMPSAAAVSGASADENAGAETKAPKHALSEEISSADTGGGETGSTDTGSGMEPEDLLGTWYRIDGEIEGDLEDTAAQGRYSTLTVYRKEAADKDRYIYYADYFDDDRYDATEQFEEVPLKVEDSPVYPDLDSTWCFASETIHTQVIEMQEDVRLQAGFIDRDTVMVVLDRSFPDSEDDYSVSYSGKFVRTVPDCYGLIPDDLVGDWEHSYTDKADGSRENEDGSMLSVLYDSGQLTVRQYGSEEDFSTGSAASEWAAYDGPVYRPSEDMETTAYNPYWNLRVDGPDYAFNENYFTLIDKDTLLWGDQML